MKKIDGRLSARATSCKFLLSFIKLCTIKRSFMENFIVKVERLSVEDFENPVSAECREITSKNRTMELFEF